MRPFFLFTIVVFSIFIIISCDNPDYSVYFRGDGIKDATLSFIQGAQSTLDICVYSITDDAVIRALSRKVMEGVRIRICTDNAYPVTVDGAFTVYDSQGLMHNKYMIADSKMVWFGSTNLTP